MKKSSLFVILFGLVSALTAQTTLNPLNFKKLFQSYQPYADLSTAFYASKGLTLVNDKVSNELCIFVKSKVDANSLESIYFALGLASLLDNCQLNTVDYAKTLENAAQSKNMLDLYYYSEVSSLLKQKFDSKQMTTSLLNALKDDNSILNQGLSLHVASVLDGEDPTFYSNLEDILEQADEIDGKYLQFEGGVATTAVVLEGVLKLGEKFGRLPAKYNAEKFEKFINHLISKRHVTNVKSAYHLLSVASRFVDNKFAIPVIVNRISPVGLTHDTPNLALSVLNIFGATLKNFEFTIDAQSDLFSGKKTFIKRSSDGSVSELKLFETNAQPGFYTVSLTVASTPVDKRLLVLNTKIEAKIQTQIEISNVQVGAADRDQANPKLSKFEQGKPVKIANADQSSKVYVKFNVNDKSKQTPFEINQAFVRFVESKSNREIIFIAEQSSSTKEYSCVVDLSQHGKSFGLLNGVYTLELIASDSLISNPQTIKLGEIKLQFADGLESLIDAKQVLYQARPEIKHLFREADARPPVLVSTIFSALCLLPLVVLILMWFNIGLNLHYFKFSLSGLVFHITLAAVFGLLYCYWRYLNMFTTMKYLTLLAVVLFVSGQRLLRDLASKKEKTA